MTVFYDDALAGVSAISNLTANLDGKFLVRNGCLEPFHKGKPFDEGVTLKLTDNPWRAENTVVSFIPFLNGNGQARMEIRCCATGCRATPASADKEMFARERGQKQMHRPVERAESWHEETSI